MDARRSSQRRQGQQTQPPLPPPQQYYPWASSLQQQQQQHRYPQLQPDLLRPLPQCPPPTNPPQQLYQQSPYPQYAQLQHPPPYQFEQQQHQHQHQHQHQQLQCQQKQRVPASKNSNWQRAPKLHQSDVDCPQDRAGDDFTPILLEETTVKCRVSGCGRSLGSDFTQASFGFVLDEDVDKVLNSSKAERKRLLLKFLRMVNTLLNQGGGLVFIHTSPHLLNFWDEQVDDDLMELVPDDTLFDENFERHLVEDHVIFRVKPLRYRPLSTLDFQSKISLNKGLVDPTHGQIRRLLSRPAPDMTSPPRATLDSGYTLVEGQRIPFHENLNVQAKVVLPKDLDKKTPKNTDTAARLMYFWWHSLKLPLYIAAFAKQQNGGSFFLGLKEEKEVSTTKWKPLPNSSGLPEALESEMRFWADDKNTEEKKLFHLAKESDVPKFEHKSGYFTCKGVSLSPHDKDAMVKLMEKNVRELLLLHPQNSLSKQLVELYFYEVKKREDDNKDIDEHAGGARGGLGKDGYGTTADNSPSSRLYVVEARVNYFHGLCFQTKRGPEAYKFDYDLRPNCSLRVPIKEWVEVQVQA